MAQGERYAIKYGVFRPLLEVMALGPRLGYIERSGDDLHVRMGWAFSTRFPISSITAVTPYSGPVGGIGVHGFGGRWLVNGAASGIVRIAIEPRARALMMGFPVKLSILSVSLEEPDQFIAEFGKASS